MNTMSTSAPSSVPSSVPSSAEGWPALPWDAWADTCEALHLWCRILGKYRLAHTPWAIHSWHATLYVVGDPRGLLARSLLGRFLTGERRCGRGDVLRVLLPYESVRTADDPEAALGAFLRSTYEAAAITGDRDRAALECEQGVSGRPRPT